MQRSGGTEPSGRHAASLDRDDYCRAGMSLLAEDGVAALTVTQLCAALGVTKGSFYHHFRGIEDYRSQLLEFWAGQQEAMVGAALREERDPREWIELLRRFGVGLPHEAEVAIRAWSLTDPAAGEVRERVDAGREALVARAYREVGAPADVADQLGRVLTAVLIGAQHRGGTTDRDSLAGMFRFVADVADRLYLSPGAPR